MQLFFRFFLLLPLLLHALVLQEEVAQELRRAGIETPLTQDENQLLDVAIIGAGQAGMSVCLALWKNQIYNVCLYERAEKGFEGPWLNSARMKCLRSSKESLLGPALGFSSLAFPLWYEKVYQDWNDLTKIPTPVWAEYLQWYREVLCLPIRNGWHLLSIIPEKDFLKLQFNENRIVKARKVILATGRNGLGGFEIPSFMHTIPKTAWFHTGELIDPGIFEKKRVVVIGAGASAFDIAATALEEKAEQVTMIMRRKYIPPVNLLDLYPCWPAFYALDDAEKVEVFQKAWEVGAPPPHESMVRLAKHPNFALLTDCCIKHLCYDKTIDVTTNQQILETDLIMLATGYCVDVAHTPELSFVADRILRWGDRHENLSVKLRNFPYLGPHFEFLERMADEAPFLKDIHCFNYGAYLSHGRISGDIDQIAIGAERIAEGIGLELHAK